MKRFLPGLCAALFLAVPAFAHDPATAGDIEISGAFTRATVPGAPVGGGYFTVVNRGGADDRLLAVTAETARTVEIHEMRLVDDVMSMRALPDGLAIPAGETVTLAPGGYHLMLMGLSGPLVEGESVPVTLVFETAGEIAVELDVRPMGARTAAGEGACHHEAEGEAAGHHHH